MNPLLRTLTCVALLATLILSVSSCDKEDDPVKDPRGTITGTVTSDTGDPVSDVTVTISGVDEDDITVTTAADGTYSAENVTIKTHAVTFAKSGWLTISVTVNAGDFDSNNVATADATLVNASAKIAGTISDAQNGGAPLADVTVTVGVAGTATSAADGTYAIENLIVDDYTVTFTKANYVTVTKHVTTADFVNGVATLNVSMGSRELLRGLSAEDLLSADKWYYNEYRGGRNGYNYPHWDWSTDYMATLDFRGAWQEQNEGTTLQIRNNEEDRSNPADLDVFDSYVYGSKFITEDNKIMSVRLRTHSADPASPAYYGVQVIDLTAAEPAPVKIGENKTYGSGDYTDVDFDLSPYVGKEVIIAIGIYRQATGDYWKQLVLRAIRFADKKVENGDWLPGTEVIPGWKLTWETVRSTMVHSRKSFTGISPIGGNRDSYVDGYRSWRGIGHVGAEWSLVPVQKDTEPFANEGYLIKTRSTADVSTEVPEAYLYAKFAVGGGSNQLTLKARNFDSGSAPGHYTYFKLTAFTEDGSAVDIKPVSNTAEDASEADNGCIKFKHYHGGKDNPDDYASFVYDLSQFDGSNVVLAFGVYNGAANTSENKLAFYSIDLN